MIDIFGHEVDKFSPLAFLHRLKADACALDCFLHTSVTLCEGGSKYSGDFSMVCRNGI
jgi:hypothetical protein